MNVRSFFRSNYRIILSVSAGILCGFALGYFLQPKMNQETKEEVRQVDYIGRINVLPDTEITCLYVFAGCDHQIERSIDPLPHVGQTQEEFLREHSDAEIQGFSSSAVLLQKLVQGPCPEHIMLRADESGQLNVYRTDSDSLEVNLIQALPLYTGSFSLDIVEELNEGTVFSSIDEINSYLENAES